MTLAQTRIHSHTKHEHAPIMFLQRHRQMHTQMKIKTYTAHTHTLAWAHKLLHKRVNVKLPAFTTLQANISKGGRKSWSSSQLSEFPPFLLTLSSSWKGNTNSWKLTPYTKLKLNSQPVNRNLQVCNSDLPHALWPLTWQRRSASGRKEGERENVAGERVAQLPRLSIMRICMVWNATYRRRNDADHRQKTAPNILKGITKLFPRHVLVEGQAIEGGRTHARHSMTAAGDMWKSLSTRTNWRLPRDFHDFLRFCAWIIPICRP